LLPEHFSTHDPAARMIPRDVSEDARDAARALSRTEAFEQFRRERKRVEVLFAHLSEFSDLTG
jgi:hypothetical protein